MIAAMRAFVPRGWELLLSTSGVFRFLYNGKSPQMSGIVDSQMEYKNGRYEINWDDLESKMTPDVRAMIVCNPQRAQLATFGGRRVIASRKTFASTTILWFHFGWEIHSDVIRSGHKFTPFASLPVEAVD